MFSDHAEKKKKKKCTVFSQFRGKPTQCIRMQLRDVVMNVNRHHLPIENVKFTRQ